MLLELLTSQSRTVRGMGLAFWVFLAVWLVGLVGTFVPALPSTAIIFVGAAVAALMNGFQANQDLVFLLTFLLFTIAAMVVDNLASAWGTKKYGGSPQSMWGALIGGLVGGLLLPPLGLFIGPPVGALLTELLIVRKPLSAALQSTWGTIVGLLTGMGAKLVLHVILGVYGLWHLWNLAKHASGA